MNKISTFREEYRFLSNFYQHPFTYKGTTYVCVRYDFSEHYRCYFDESEK